MKKTIKISAQPRYLPEQSNALVDEYSFAYQITIENLGLDTVTLRRRYWKIRDAQGRIQEVEGPGVVGEEPTLEPMAQFSYTSGAKLQTPWGSMEGYYEFESAARERFRVPIERFELKSDMQLQ